VSSQYGTKGRGDWPAARRPARAPRSLPPPPAPPSTTLPPRGGAGTNPATAREPHLRERDETCPVSTEGWTRRVHFVREVGGGGHPATARVGRSRGLSAPKPLPEGVIRETVGLCTPGRE
jgi:hypothetical protein